MEWLMRFDRFLAAVVMLGLANCSTVTTGTTQVVSVETTPVQGATCELSNEKGRWNVPSTPGSTSVSRSYGDLNVVCSYPNGAKGVTTVASTTQPSAFGNILVGGVGAAVDMSDGAAFGYPSLVTVRLATMAPQEDSRLVQCVNRGSVHWLNTASCLDLGGLPADPIETGVR
jgi:hypothetical protein